MPGKKRARGPELPRTVSINGGLHKTPNRLTKAEIAVLGRFLDCARIIKSRRKRDRRWRPVPRQLWEPLAQAVAQAHGVTVRQMFFGPSGYRFVIPRARFWRCLRWITKGGKPRYSWPAIAAITGHHHTSVMHLAQSGTADLDYPTALVRAVRYERADAVATQRAADPASVAPWKRRDHTGEQYGTMTVSGPAEAPDGKPGRWWHCSCTCGSATVQSTRALVQGKGACGVGHRASPVNLVTHARERTARQL